METEGYIKTFKHFSLRLVERYGLFITFEEYVFLCELPFIKKPKRVNNHSIEGVIKIQNINVKVIKSMWRKDFRPLITVLPLKK